MMKRASMDDDGRPHFMIDGVPIPVDDDRVCEDPDHCDHDGHWYAQVVEMTAGDLAAIDPTLSQRIVARHPDKFIASPDEPSTPS
jgi:hypothetical protein